MKNEIQKGDILDLTAPVGGVTSGTVYQIGKLVVCAVVTADAGDKFAALHSNVINYAVASADTPAEGDYAYWDDTAKEFTTVASTNQQGGWFVTAKDSNNEAWIKLGGQTV